MHYASSCPNRDPRVSGAALIIALSVLLVLLSIAITFALIVRYEADMTAMVYEGAQADNMLDAALAKAMYRLNRDLDVHPDALSLDHGWRTWFNGAAFVGKQWTREQRGLKSGRALYFNEQGLVSINISDAEDALGGMLYVLFTEDRHLEPLFRGPRTEHWLHVPRQQDNRIILYAVPGEARILNNQGVTIEDAALNAAGIFWVYDPDVSLPFVTADFLDMTDLDLNRARLPAEQVNAWADVDNTGDGMRDSIWRPIARDIDHHGDGIDNTLDGLIDPWRGDEPLFESAPFVYRGDQPRFNVDTGEWEQGPGMRRPFDDENLYLTVPLPGMIMQIDLNSDGVFDERDHYCADPNNPDTCGPVFVRLPDSITVMTNQGPQTLTRENVDTLDNDYDLFVNNFRSYAYVGPHAPLTDIQYATFYRRNQIPHSRAEQAGDRYSEGNTLSWNGWLPHTDIENPASNRQWLEADRNDPRFAAAHHRAYHDINVPAVFGGPESLEFFYIDSSGEAVPLPGANPLVQILRRPNALRITCSGESVSEIVGRAAIHISDEAGKVNLNAAGGYIHDPDPGNEPLLRALNQGVSSFEYETRLLPDIGTARARQFWGIRTGASPDGNRFEPMPGGQILNPDRAMPGYGGVDDNGNAFLLAMSGYDASGTGLIDDGLRLPRLSDSTRGILTGDIADPEAILEQLRIKETTVTRFDDYYDRLGRLEGIDEPQELRLFNPLRNYVDDQIADRLLLRKEELRRHEDVGTGTWDYLRHLVTVNSDTRNIFAVQGHGVRRQFLKLDPNTATPQQLAATLLIKGDVASITDRLRDRLRNRLPELTPGEIEETAAFAEGLRQFDRSYEGRLMGGPNVVFPADPVLQTMRLAADIVSARDRTAQRHRLVTENLVRNPDIYRGFLNMGPQEPFSFPPEQLNERERIPDHELMPTGDVQEYLDGALGVAPEDKRLIAPDPWWKEQTGEDRNFQYAAASADAIRINEIMVRPVRRVEAETQGKFFDPVSQEHVPYWTMPGEIPPLNLDPAPYPGMLNFDVITPAPLFEPIPDNNFWVMQSAYDHVEPQPLLGERTAWTYTAPNPAALAEQWISMPDGTEWVNPEIIEFRFRPSEGLPPGRYYLKVNVTDHLGNMSVAEPGVLDYAIKYASALSDEDTITADVQGLIEQYVAALTEGNMTAVEFILDMINGLWQTVDAPDFIASPLARNHGSAAPPGWVFLPSRRPVYQPDDDSAFDKILTRIGVSSTSRVTRPWPHIIYLYYYPWLDNPANTPPGCRPLGVSLYEVFQAAEIHSDPTPENLRDDLDRDEAALAAVWNLIDIYISDILALAADNPACFPHLINEFAPDWLTIVTMMRTFFHPMGLSYFRDGTVAFPPPRRTSYPLDDDPTFTVIVPDYDEDLELCVAFRLNPNRAYLLDADLIPTIPRTIAINFFDFSQEPSHEYIELVNVTDEEVDLGGWTLEVGIPDPPGAVQDPYMRDPYKSIWRIPNGTRIAPKGHLLLGFDVFDHSGITRNPEILHQLPQGPVIGANAMGLAAGMAPNPDRGIAEGVLAFVTEPPIGHVPVLPDISDPEPYQDLTGSVFRRNTMSDYIDNTGDGLSSAAMVLADLANVDDEFQRDTDRWFEEYRTHGIVGPDGEIMIPPWARIVQLENRQLWWESNVPPELAEVTEDDSVERYLWRVNPYRRDRRPLNTRDINTVERLAQLVLRGGILPNYPERDGIDNDGDGGYVVRDDIGALSYLSLEPDTPVFSVEPLLRYVPGTLDKDMIDNTLDGWIDPRGVELPAAYDDPLAFSSHGNPFLSEGVDEGRLGVPIYYNGVPSGFPGFLTLDVTRPRMYGPGSFEAGVMPIRMLSGELLNDYRIWTEVLREPDSLFALVAADLWPETGFFYERYLPEVLPIYIPMPVVSPADSPEWKAFVERRWNPGDNVLVTLYVGSASDGRVADQVSYREYDVINRTIDDIVESPYLIDGFRNYSYDPATETVYWGGPAGAVPPQDNVAALDPDRLSFWLPDHMGLDFYRSLERKHPLYHGDRFGLANRWTPTSGAYDDWADSLSVFEALEDRRADPPNSEFAARFIDNPVNLRLFGHAFWGSPLRMNTMARLWENPPDLARIEIEPEPGYLFEPPHLLGNRRRRQFVASDRVLAPALFSRPEEQFALRAEPSPDFTRYNADYALERARIPNRPFATLGEMLALPQLSFHEYLSESGDSLPRSPRSLPNLAYVPRIPNPNVHHLQPGDPSGEMAGILAPLWRQDATLLTGTLAQAAVGGPLTALELRDAEERPGRLAATPLESCSLNPTVLTVGQARVAPLWPGPGSGIEMQNLRELFRWQGADPPHMWTPVYLFGPPEDSGLLPERHWLEAEYPATSDGMPPFRLDNAGDPLITPPYLFNGAFMAARLGYAAWNELARRWPVRPVASITAVDRSDAFTDTALLHQKDRAPSDRAVMYVSRHRPDLEDTNRAEALFVWDRDSGLENGTYIAYVGTFIPGMKQRMDEAHNMVRDISVAAGVGEIERLKGEGADEILRLDPDYVRAADVRRFEPMLALEFITDRRAAEIMQVQGGALAGTTGLRHPLDWTPHEAAAVTYRARDDGYIFYSADPRIQWRPIPVRVTENYLALRVRNMGASGQVACITHVVLAPAPRNRGQINVNTAETHRVVRGVTDSANNWNIELFNALMGVPGVVTALTDGLPPPSEDLALPDTGWFSHDLLPDPWRMRWQTAPERAMLGELGPMPPPIRATNIPLLDSDGEGTPIGSWDSALIRLVSLIVGNRPAHPDGRYYRSLDELLEGIVVGGESMPDQAFEPAPWPLSNLGIPPDTPTSDILNVLPVRETPLIAARYDEIMNRFSRMSNLSATRSDVFEIIATVQAGNVMQDEGGAYDYRGEAFMPTSETRARIIYDRRARTVRVDESRGTGGLEEN